MRRTVVYCIVAADVTRRSRDGQSNSCSAGDTRCNDQRCSRRWGQSGSTSYGESERGAVVLTSPRPQARGARAAHGDRSRTRNVGCRCAAGFGLVEITMTEFEPDEFPRVTTPIGRRQDGFLDAMAGKPQLSDDEDYADGYKVGAEALKRKEQPQQART